MNSEVLVPFEKADFLRDTIATLKTFLTGLNDDDHSDEWHKGFDAGIKRAIFHINEHIKRDDNVRPQKP